VVHEDGQYRPPQNARHKPKDSSGKDFTMRTLNIIALIAATATPALASAQPAVSLSPLLYGVSTTLAELSSDERNGKVSELSIEERKSTFAELSVEERAPNSFAELSVEERNSHIS